MPLRAWRFDSSQPHRSGGREVHSRAEVLEVMALRKQYGFGARRIAARTGLPVATVRDWLAGKLPAHSRPEPEAVCRRCGHAEHAFADLSAAYVYLLGLYLGDGSIATSPRSVYRLRISLDARYPKIIEACADAIREVLPRNRVGLNIPRHVVRGVVLLQIVAMPVPTARPVQKNTNDLSDSRAGSESLSPSGLRPSSAASSNLTATAFGTPDASGRVRDTGS